MDSADFKSVIGALQAQEQKIRSQDEQLGSIRLELQEADKRREAANLEVTARLHYLQHLEVPSTAADGARAPLCKLVGRSFLQRSDNAVWMRGSVFTPVFQLYHATLHLLILGYPWLTEHCPHLYIYIYIQLCRGSSSGNFAS